MISELSTDLPEYGTYIEPFVGGGALLLSLEPERAIINDYNPELVNLYRVVRDDPEGLIALLRQHKANHSSDYYYQVRSMDRVGDFSKLPATVRASRFLYLNKTCFNGLWRVNSDGFNNVPIGRYKDPEICNAEAVRAVSEYFNRADITISNGDFERACVGACEGDFVYFDPPYDNTFVGYTDGGFNKAEQERLARVFGELTDKGVRCMLSNSDTEFIRELYADYNIRTVQCSRAINAKGDGRGKVNEVVVTNYGTQ